MEDAINSGEQQKPSGGTSESSKKWNTPTGLPQTTQTAQQANKSPNKPNQGWKSTKGKNMRQNETRRKELPHFVRTEMEILKHLRRVNRDLRILLQPKYNCISTPRVNKSHQPVTQCREPPVIKAGNSRVGAVGRKSQNALAKAINVNPKRPTQHLKPTAGTNRVAPLPTNQSCTRKPQSGVQALPQKFSTATRRSARTLQRLMLYFKPKRKPDSSQCAQKPVIKDNNKSVANEAIKCKTDTLCRKLKRGLQATRIAKEKVKTRYPTKLAEQSVKDVEALKHKLSEEKVLKQRVMGRARILKQKVTNGKSLKQIVKDEETPKQQVKAMEPPKPTAKEKEPASPSVKNERTIGEKTLAFRLNCLRAETKSLQNEDESKSALIVNKKKLFSRTPEVLASNAECALQDKKTVREIESTISHGRFGNCLPFLKARKKAPVRVTTLEEKASSETELKKVYKKRKFRYSTANIDHLPSSSHTNMKYVEAINAIRRHNRNIYKDPHETPSTSSLEEYFHVLSERMAREQKEADERKPRRRGRRGTSNYNLPRRRVRPPIK
ncbi:neurofilament heavy polypeptide-like [Bactrocera neohumeralis]|uniref:neurofilament heavy polypeptide-like n=1 Tax=Bactrocera tryoni TaxID=59916 RepID=UPI001A9980ED|nr:neurofilament heavy polypeptide-like [Bactrocera tryoni]XP_050330668.1 neurofilament heavy polypeptide-like [Bactrocera neohumeralis]